MIGNVGSPEKHAGEHKITNCMHRTGNNIPKLGEMQNGGMAALEAEKDTEDKINHNPLPVKGFLNESIKGLWGKIGVCFGIFSGNEKVGHETVIRQASQSIETKGNETEKEGMQVMASALIEADLIGGKKGADKTEEEEETKKIESSGLSSGEGLKNGFKNLRNNLKKWGNVASGIKEKISRIEKEHTDTDTIKSSDSSYLLDSYNKKGEYQSLAAERSLEGKFKAKG